MNRIKYLLLAIAILASCSVKAQFMQDKGKYEYMFKAELGYMPFISNFTNNKGENGYYIENQQHIANVNIINGLNISQDFFVGLNLGYGYVAEIADMANGKHNIMVGIDADFRPINEEFAPIVYGKLGASYLLSSGANGNTLTPYFEIGTGLNWFFSYAMRNMEHNYKTVYLTVGAAYMQQSLFIPVRLGYRF